MKQFEKCASLLLALALSLSLTACGGSDGEAVGDDWRTSGVVVGSGTITHEGEGSVDVLVTVDESSAAFYRDEQTQILFDSVSFPMTIPDAEQNFTAISFDDIDGDGGSDVYISFIDENNDMMELVWIWDDAERYVFREDLSSVTLGGDGEESGEAYFTSYGLEINAVMDAGTFLLENGASSYLNGGEGYSTRDCYWELVKNYDQFHDGIREIQFDAICYIPKAANAYADSQANVATAGALYDFYTGVWLTDSTTYDNSERGENYYVHTIDWNGQSAQIEFSYSTDWQNDVGDWSKVLTQSYVVYLPEDYDGLIFAAVPEPDNYNDCIKHQQMDVVYPEACIMDIDLIDPYGCLFYSVCY